VIVALSKRYSPPAWAFLEQVADGTGALASRFADAMAMSLWPSRGLDLVGFEVKVHRGDWLRELKDPRKSESHALSCNRWYVVAPSGVIEVGEVPPAWGFIELRGGRLFTVREAERRDAEPGWPLVAAILRRAAESHVPKSAVDAVVAEQVEERLRVSKISEGRDVENLRSAVKNLEERIRTFEEASGIRIDHWTAREVGEAFRRFLHGDRTEEAQVNRLRAMKASVTQLLFALDHILESAERAKKELDVA